MTYRVIHRGEHMKKLIVVGAGHAGVEAAMASAKMGIDTKLITLDKDMMATLACNPSIGGPAKGVVVREVDALGGVMGRVADLTSLQVKMLNMAKGPGVRALRNQVDKIEYSKLMLKTVSQQENLEIIEDQVTSLIIDQETVKGVVLADGTELLSDVVILTTGTFLASEIMIGHEVEAIGADDQLTTTGISEKLSHNNIEIMRLKTGTPARLHKDSLNYDKMEIQPGDQEFNAFSWQTKPEEIIAEQLPCYLTYTHPGTHEIIESNLDKSSMYGGQVTGAGARYCPSVEDKIVRFADKDRHQIFVEPESLHLESTYVQGLSTSLPAEIQDEMIRSVPGLENAEIMKYGYAIEYDAINPIQLKPTLESLLIDNLFFAGQINGTSGYEEAAGQGIMAGINAALKLQGKEPFILRRDEAYIGVMIDDLVTKGTQEPYRLLTSRSEYRLLMRHDNADDRLTEYGYQFNIVSDEQYQHYQNKLEVKDSIIEVLKNNTFTGSDRINDYLIEAGYDQLETRMSAYELLKRPHITIDRLSEYLDEKINLRIGELVEIDVKYAGYIEKAKREAEKMQKMEAVRIFESIDYDDVEHLSQEGREKLTLIKPATLGQASRISGVNPADISVLSHYLSNYNHKN